MCSQNFLVVIKAFGVAVHDQLIFSISIGLGLNNDFKRCRENNTRKAAAILTNEDVMRYLFVSSDPYIFIKRYKQKKKINELLPEAKQLLLLDAESDLELSD